jgi:DNA-binding response OmpR family regulator
MDKHIFVVDDDSNIAELIRLYFEKEGYKVSVFSNGPSALTALKQQAPMLMVLDIMMPMMDGYEVLKEVRRMSKLPIIMLTSKGETFDKVLGLELGADDYLVKPFEPKELLARVKAVFRRVYDKDDSTEVMILPNLTIDMDEFSITYHGQVIQLPPKELELLNYLAKHPNRVFTREQLLDQIWGFDYYGDTRTVDVHIKRLREKFSQEDPWEIKTVWGVGYKFSR